MLDWSCASVLDVLLEMALKLALLTNKRKVMVGILAISLTFIPLAFFSSRRTVVRKKASLRNLSVEDVYNPVRVSLETSPQRPAATQSDNISVVPNIVHYVWLGGDLNFSFIHYLSFKSVDRFIQPRVIYVYGEVVPTDAWWNRVISEIGNVYHVRVDAPVLAPNGKHFRHAAHKSDFLRFNLLSSELKLLMSTKFCLL